MAQDSPARCDHSIELTKREARERQKSALPSFFQQQHLDGIKVGVRNVKARSLVHGPIRLPHRDQQYDLGDSSLKNWILRGVIKMR